MQTMERLPEVGDEKEGKQSFWLALALGGIYSLICWFGVMLWKLFFKKNESPRI